MEGGPRHGQDDELGDAIADGNGKGRVGAVPAGNHQRSLIVGVDQADQVAQHQAVPVPQARARQDHRAVPRVGNVDGQAGGHQGRRTRGQLEGAFEGGTQVHAGGARRGVLRQGNLAPQARIEDLELHADHAAPGRAAR